MTSAATSNAIAAASEMIWRRPRRVFFWETTQEGIFWETTQEGLFLGDDPGGSFFGETTQEGRPTMERPRRGVLLFVFAEEVFEGAIVHSFAIG
jgi:hypothetical protein